jgi:3,4-dihydroxy 2-butanone 4-phosphate synthase/GTP cyclohydrolase II
MAITGSTILHLKYGCFKACFHKTEFGDCVSFSRGDITRGEPIVRIHSACLFGEAFHSLHCDCGEQLDKTLKMIVKRKSGVIIYTYAEGRGIGLENKIKSMNIEREKKVNTIQAFNSLGYAKSDLRDYKREIIALRDLKLSKNIIIVSNNPHKLKELECDGYIIKKIIKQKIKHNKFNRNELFLKKEKKLYYID